MSDALLDDLRRAATPVAPKDFTPGVKYVGAEPVTITTPPLEKLESEAEWIQAVRDMGVPLPEGKTLELVEARYDEGGWTRGAQGEDALTKPVWRYKFRVVDRAIAGAEDLAALFAEAEEYANSGFFKAPEVKVTGTTMVISLADFQIGKSDDRGGTPELLKRLAVARRLVVERAIAMKPAQIVLVDAGDALEGFESAPNAERTNDLQHTEQMTVWRRLLWAFVSDLAFLTPDLVVVGVPSNHCRVRRGKQAVGPANDDYGLMTLGIIKDLAETAGFDHVRVLVPAGLDESLAFTLAGGKTLGVLHGHQKSRPELLCDWVKSQGRRPIGQADIVVAGHFHSYFQRQFGDRQWMFVSPTMDAGSSWYRNLAGEDSETGILTFMVDENGWRDVYVAWT